MKNSKVQSLVLRFCSLAIAVSCLVPVGRAFAAEAKENEQELIATLQSQAAGGEKAIACKKLAIFGSAKAVPALAPLLADEQLSSWARIALEAIPGPAADQALRNALQNVRGRQLVGVINSIGVRRDAEAVPALTSLLKNTEADVASAAAVALGRVGGDKAAKSLQQFVEKAPAPVRAAAAEGCIRCAEGYLAQGKTPPAIKLYDSVRKAQVPKQQLLDATRGAILARQAKGVPLLVEQLRSPDKAMFGMAVSTARELPGPEATKAVAQELRRAVPQRQPLILLALADRSDPAAMPTIVDCARNGSQQLRLTAVGVLEKQGNVSNVPLLLECATGADADIAAAAKASLVRLYGSEIDRAIEQQLPQSKGKLRQALIEVASKRGIETAVPEFAKTANDSDEAVRNASLQAIGALGGAEQIPGLIGLLRQTSAAKDQSPVEQALLGICSRLGSACAPEVQALATEGSAPLKIIAVHALASAGGPEALATLQKTTHDSDSSVQDEAVRTLSSWPNTWPEDDAIAKALLNVASESPNPTHKVLATRGYLQFLQGDKKLSQQDKVSMLKEALPVMQRAEEKRSAIAFAQKIQTPDSLKLLASLTSDSAVAQDACAALLDLAGKPRRGLSKEDRQQALQVVTEKSSSDTDKQKAEAALKSLE